MEEEKTQIFKFQIMFKRIYNYTLILAASLFFAVACKDDEADRIEKFTSNIDVSNSLLKDDKYTMSFLFSTDDGKTWVDYPVIKPGQAYMVKVVNVVTEGGVITKEPVTADDAFEFDWSKSTPAPVGDATAETAKFTSGKVNDVKVSIVSHLCTYSASSWTGDWGGDEVGACCGGTDANAIRQDATDPNKFIMDNFWGDGVDAYFILNPSSTSVFEQVLTMPKQVTSEGGIAEGTGTYDQCAGTFTIKTKYTFPGLSNAPGLSTADAVRALQVQTMAVSATSDARLYVATPIGVFYTGDSGGQFALRSTAMTGTTVKQMAATGNKVYAATANGVYYSPDRAVTFALANTGLTNTNVTSVMVSGANVFAGTDGGGVFLSTNSGSNWAPANVGITNMFVTAMAASGTDLYAATKGGIFYSSDAGATWTPKTSNIVNVFTTLSALGTRVLAGSSSGLFYSNDKGATWKAVDAGKTADASGLTGANIISVAAAGTVANPDAYVSTADGVFYSADGGLTWEKLTKGLASAKVVSLVTAPTLPTKVYLGTADAGAFRTEHKDDTWDKKMGEY